VFWLTTAGPMKTACPIGIVTVPAAVRVCPVDEVDPVKA
jgi:hypothetical protein